MFGWKNSKAKDPSFVYTHFYRHIYKGIENEWKVGGSVSPQFVHERKNKIVYKRVLQENRNTSKNKIYWWLHQQSRKKEILNPQRRFYCIEMIEGPRGKLKTFYVTDDNW